jgi:hypothetical protein
MLENFQDPTMLYDRFKTLMLFLFHTMPDPMFERLGKQYKAHRSLRALLWRAMHGIHNIHWLVKHGEFSKLKSGKFQVTHEDAIWFEEHVCAVVRPFNVHDKSQQHRILVVLTSMLDMATTLNDTLQRPISIRGAQLWTCIPQAGVGNRMVTITATQMHEWFERMFPRIRIPPPKARPRGQYQEAAIWAMVFNRRILRRNRAIQRRSPATSVIHVHRADLVHRGHQHSQIASRSSHHRSSARCPTYSTMACHQAWLKSSTGTCMIASSRGRMQ